MDKTKIVSTTELAHSSLVGSYFSRLRASAGQSPRPHSEYMSSARMGEDTSALIPAGMPV